MKHVFEGKIKAREISGDNLRPVWSVDDAQIDHLLLTAFDQRPAGFVHDRAMKSKTFDGPNVRITIEVLE